MTKNQTADAARDRRCPFCLASLGFHRQGSDDHLFGEAFGGTATVRACSDCNSKLGHSVEGPLQWDDSVLNLLKIRLGNAQAVKGTLPSGAAGSLDFVTGEVRTRKPVHATEDALHYLGSMRQVQQALPKKLPPAEVERLISTAKSVSLGEGTFRSTLKFDLGLWARMVAKMALAAGVRVAPELFTSDAAGHLRDVCWGRADPVGDPLAVAGFSRLEERLDGIVREYPEATRLEPFPEGNHGQMLFVSSVPGRLACVPRIAGQEMPGIVVNWPGEQWSRVGVLVTDTGDGDVATRDLFQDLKRCLGQ
jgi:hypothetical protein